MKNPLNYRKPAAKIILGHVLDLLAAGPASTSQLIAITGKSAGRARDYLMYLREIGQIHCIADAVNGFEGSTPAMWALDPAYVEVATLEMDDSIDLHPRRVIVRTTWAPNHVRMAMECLLFGVPKVLQGVAA